MVLLKQRPEGRINYLGKGESYGTSNRHQNMQYLWVENPIASDTQDDRMGRWIQWLRKARVRLF
jgi:hypothetical protein